MSLVIEPVDVCNVPELITLGKSIESDVRIELERYVPDIYPMGEHRHITSEYGYRTDPITFKRGRFHDGVDYRCPIGTPVVATMDGDMRGYMDKHGAKMIILVNDDYWVAYGHLSERVFRLEVSKGDTIGYSGNTGRTTGPHLHYSVYKRETAHERVSIDPMSIIKQVQS